MSAVILTVTTTTSPSSRRAWVEIVADHQKQYRQIVALLAEGVGRNRAYARIWNEWFRVALLAEGVGRNANIG